MAIALPGLQDEISRVLKAIADDAGVKPEQTRDFTRAEAIVRRMKGLNELNDPAIIAFADSRRFEEVIAALAIKTNVPSALIAKAIEGCRADLVLIPCRAAALAWPTVKAILSHRQVKDRIDARTLAIAGNDYGKLSVDTAQRTLRFWQLHDKIDSF
jgi:hypothetical protein